ncbi:hypothetical protein Q4E93_27180 [Flavitalea sp. BT771]|uniref:hypothetical protein n=1 Tax=Flavitalea sp. BT771 TaxID=3063329 RepID=UPI0026E4289D|nr:hypothetical protein [Flavitalea sp. BT771]MDO6434324.1 hypothetical protein [Flavitalea sp. BT771]MDV6223224.1 hypothetical protein [Flavitalea sp. BT771]
MNKIILSIATVLMMGLSAFANGTDETDVNQLAVKSFHKDFGNAKNIRWEQKTGYVKVEFTMNDQVLYAYYNNDGQMTAVVRNIVSDQLPISLLTPLKRDYTGFWISDLFEIAADEQTTYYVTLENADKKIVLRSNGIDSWEVYSKTKKTAEQ